MTQQKETANTINENGIKSQIVKAFMGCDHAIHIITKHSDEYAIRYFYDPLTGIQKRIEIRQTIDGAVRQLKSTHIVYEVTIASITPIQMKLDPEHISAIKTYEEMLDGILRIITDAEMNNEQYSEAQKILKWTTNEIWPEIASIRNKIRRTLGDDYRGIRRTPGDDYRGIRTAHRTGE